MLLSVLMLLFSTSAFAQLEGHTPDKPGTWTIKNNLENCEGKLDKTAFTSKLTNIAEWMHQNHTILKSPKGFDAVTVLWTNCYHYSKYPLHACEYGYVGEIEFQFQIFSVHNGKPEKWIIEPPHWDIDVNNVYSGHGTNFHYEGYRVQEEDPKIEIPLENIVTKLSEFFVSYPVEKEIAPGITLYGDGNLMIANPDRPPYWIPVTVKEVLQLLLEYSSIKPDSKMLYPYFKKEYDSYTEEQLNSPAYNGTDNLSKVTPEKAGLQFMRFNPAYYDRSLPKSAVQLMWLYYKPDTSEANMEEYIRNNGHPKYSLLLTNQLQIEQLGSLIDKK